MRIKEPRFAHDDDFSTGDFSVSFDCILAQSIFSHTGPDLIEKTLKNFRHAISDDGLIAATFVEEASDYHGSGWVYPDCVGYRPESIVGFAEKAGLATINIPWYHPRQSWYLLAKRSERLPDVSAARYLHGAVLANPEFGESCQSGPRARTYVVHESHGKLPATMKRRGRRWLQRFVGR